MPRINFQDENRRLAMLIDGDNIQSSLIKEILAEASRYGLIRIKRIYGDWTADNMKPWKEVLQTYAIQPIQQFRNTVGKNATDSSLIIDAMDIVYEEVVDGFCLVSSDSDFTRLATRIREKGLFVMGVGHEITPKAFVNACDVFTYTENLVPGDKARQPEKSIKSSIKKDVTSPDPIPLIKRALDISAQDDGWALLATVGAKLRQLDPGFDPRTYGHKQLAQLIKSFPAEFETKEKSSKAGASVVSIRSK
ncbi:MAG: NYN domain-containing protein [Chloroflexota bacterium]